MKFEIKHRVTGSIVFNIETSSWKLAVEAAIRSGANLSYADLRGADLRGADLGSANLRGADLRGADLGSANLRGADLRGADLRGADLGSANLRGADLRGANLIGADLGSADLGSADLSSADLSGADLIIFQFQEHWAYYTFDGSLRIGCIVLPITEWVDTFRDIGLQEKYTEEQILMYGQFINMCFEHFKRTNK